MTSLQMREVAVPSYDKLKMEDRKRSLVTDADDLAPSRKKLLKDENGQAMRMEADKEKDVEVRTVCSRAQGPSTYFLSRTSKKMPSCGR